jgi:hypothetical protein
VRRRSLDRVGGGEPWDIFAGLTIQSVRTIAAPAGPTTGIWTR